jgi:carboxyl-terminal processing protease
MYINKPAPREGRTQYIEVVSPIEDTPAFRAGLMAGDRIRAVEGESTADLSTDEVVDRLRGRPGTPVTITILRGADIEFPVTLERAIIQIPTARWAMIDDDVAFLRIIQFTPHTAERVAEALQEFRSSNYRSLIVDLRSNPGGLLTGVVDVADLFLDGGAVVETRGRVASENQMFTARSGSLISDDIEIVVLIDGGSASAAEILAAALNDRQRATLIGTTTFGKGSVQQVRRIGDSGFRLTMSRYYSPAGTSIDKAGVAPAIEVADEELTEEQQQAYATIRREDRVRTFLEASSDPSGAEIDRFVQGLQDEGLDPGDRLLRRFIRMEINRVNNREQIFDLEYDRVLRRAIEYLHR